MRILLVGAGGFIGSVLRYLGSTAAQSLVPGSALPIGTLAVNVTGCLLIGALSQLAEARELFTPDHRAFLLTGLLGGFTTFSAFGHETLKLFRGGQLAFAVGNVAAQVGLGLLAVWLGMSLAALWWR